MKNSHKKENNRFSLRFLTVAMLCLVSVFSTAQTGSWHAYMAYYDVQQIVKGGDRLYIRASNDLYSYNLNDHSITTYDKIRQLSDASISRIAWNPTAKNLLILYNNYNIDLLFPNDEVFNLGSYYLKTMTQDKTVNNIYVYDKYIYLCTTFGIIKVNMQREEIAESYILNQNIEAVGVSNGQLYAKTATGVITGSLTDNLIDPHNWSDTLDYPADIFTASNADWEQYHDLVATLQPGGPQFNNFGTMRFKNGMLYTVGAGYNCMAELRRPGRIQMLKNGEWSFLGEDVAEKTGHWFEDVDDIDVDPNDSNHIFVGGKTGLYEFRDGEFVREYTIDNSPLTSTLGNTHAQAKNYNLVEGLSFDDNGNLWLVNAGSSDKYILELTKEGEWNTWSPSELFNGKKALKGMQKVLCDSRGYVWFVNYHWEVPSFYCFDPVSGDFIKKYVNEKINQDGVAYNFTPSCLLEDMDNNIWVGTNMGLFMIEKEKIVPGNDDHTVTQIKVPRNDGSDFADYLMGSEVITSMVMDDAGRKWIGSQTQGVYLISADNMEEIHHFTTNNSDILSNSIESLAINPLTGEVFFGTTIGLCSYISDATSAVKDMTKENVYAFPNPVPSGYNGQITIRGLSFDADVKILTISGRLVAQGRSNGGTFTWNGRDSHGRQVASGVYMIATATRDGKAGVVSKVAIVR